MVLSNPILSQNGPTKYNAFMKRWFAFVFLLTLLLGYMTQRANAQNDTNLRILVLPGDSWEALAIRFQVDETVLQELNPHINQQRQLAIGTEVILPETAVEQSGRLIRPGGNLLATAVRYQTSPWLLAIRNERASPFTPTLYQPILVPDETSTPRDLPAGFNHLELSQMVGVPGQAVGLRAEIEPGLQITAVLDDNEMDLFANGSFANESFADGSYLVGLTGTGAFFGTQQPTLQIRVGDTSLWEQPWQFRDPADWEYQELTLTGAAAQIDQQSIEEERARLLAIWGQNSGAAQWHTPFQLPINNYLTISSTFGARRSYNGGPYRTYHEGVDFAAYGGTPVMAPARGTVVLAEVLYVRGGAVIIDHGLGIYTGFYHMSSVNAAPGDVVEPGQILGEVGTTGLSTGNHLHWDLLVNGIWVDAQAWLEQRMDCWILAGLNQPCQ